MYKRSDLKKYKKMMEGKHVLVVCPGHNLLLYEEKIKDYIKKNRKNMVLIGCGRMHHIIIPDYQLWNDRRGFGIYGKHMSQKPFHVFRHHFSKKIIRKYIKGDYGIVEMNNTSSLKRKDSYDNIKFGYKKNGKVIFGNFKTIGCRAIFWAHACGAKKIEVVGKDGYTFYSRKDLEEGQNKTKKISQYCWGKGFSGWTVRGWSIRRMGKKKIYKYFKKEKDDIIYKVLRGMRDYGVKFKILTPTVFKEFYDSSVLGIRSEKDI